MEKKETCVFKKGDRVFYFATGWNEITAIEGRRIHLKSEIEITGESEWEIYDTDWCMLSFTEYTLHGLTQQRPLPEIKIGQTIYVRFPNAGWHERNFSGYDPEGVWCYSEDHLGNLDSQMFWPEYSITNPLEPCATKQG